MTTAISRPHSGDSRPTTVIVNGTAQSLQSTMLLSALRDELGLTGAKPGCGEGVCGSCTVLVDGEPVRACQQAVATLAGQEITTIEGLATAGRLHPVQQAFVEAGAAQCGYCTPGMVLAVAALLSHDSNPDDDAVNEALSGNVCRCGTYQRIRLAVKRAADISASVTAGTGPSSVVAADDWELSEPSSPGSRSARPWDLTDPDKRDWFGMLGDGMVVVLPPPEPSTETWSTAGGGAWLHVSDAGKVTAFTGKVDVGQDNRTALRMLVAEELSVPLDKVRLIMGDTDLCPYDMGTFGSRSMPDAGTALCRVAAHARTLLPVPPGARRIEIVTGEPICTAPADWHCAGNPLVAPGTLDLVTGARRFVSDLSLPGMWHGMVLRPPVLGARLRYLDTTAVDDRPGVVVVRTPKLVAVVAADRGAARGALAELRADWELPEMPSEDDLEAFLRSHPAKDVDHWSQPVLREVGGPDGALASAPVRLEATYSTSYIAHGPLEPRVAVAVWDGDERLTIWTGTQTPFAVRAQVAGSLNLAEENVRVVVAPTGGGFGGKHAGGVAAEAAVLAREIGKPVRVAWTRHEEFTAGTLRPAAVIDVAAGATSGGELTAWSFVNINSGPAALAPPYWVANQRLEYRPAESPLLQGSYRALAANANNFARESFIDELAHELGRDPAEYRLDLLADERLGAVLRAVADHVGWATRRTGTGWGIACGLEKEGRVATAAEVRLDRDGLVKVARLVIGYECGAIVNPETVTNQIEGAAVMALGGALFEEIRFSKGMITNGTFSDYRVPRIYDVPSIEVVLLDRTDLPSAGAGETPMIAVAPAIANAIFDATGRRLRSLPLASLAHRSQDVTSGEIGR
ncbi:MAG: molybdopterin cofactor-binding domain-containing protein [Acidimicrobiales bacterium]